MDPLTLWMLEMVFEWSRIAAGLVILSAIAWYGYVWLTTRRPRRQRW